VDVYVQVVYGILLLCLGFELEFGVQCVEVGQDILDVGAVGVEYY
jgi:hypothetical protein